jgi:peptidoglycan/xylan/chitin deacetylase (PgdA/CDA1 family)
MFLKKHNYRTVLLCTLFLVACNKPQKVSFSNFTDNGNMLFDNPLAGTFVEDSNKTIAKSQSLYHKNFEQVFTNLSNATSFANTIQNKYINIKPSQWGENVSGVKHRLNTKDAVVALTLDACGGTRGCGYDKDLINFLIQQNICATLFLNSRWIDTNPKVFQSLSKNPLFEIENHGYAHKPLSVSGKSAFDIKGTSSIREVIDEVALNSKKIFNLTGKKPKFFRPGTAFCDEVAVKIAKDLGEEVVRFSVIGDAGATYSKDQVKKACLDSSNGSIIICHMNHPEKDTAEGLKLALPELIKRGIKFVKLEDYSLK